MKTSFLLKYLSENGIPFTASPFVVAGEYISQTLPENLSFGGSSRFLQQLVARTGKPIYEVSVFVGRFQPIHNEHLSTIKSGLQISEKLVVVLGSAKRPRDPKNPWKDSEREEMIRASLSEEENARTFFLPMQDFWYNNPLWFVKVHEGVKRFVGSGKTITIIGFEKDATSWYLKGFPQWDFVPFYSKETTSATDVRAKLFQSTEVSEKTFEYLPIPFATANYLMEWFRKNPEIVDSLIKENIFLQEYRKKWDKAPFKPTFVTVDAVVVKSAHVLLVRRGRNPGKGLLALPGGFLNQEEEIEDAALRELREETKIKVSDDELRNSIETSRVFSHPGRDLRGRTITHAYLIDLGIGDLPLVKGSDDADEALWVPLAEVHDRAEEFFGDHYAIITNLVHSL